MIHSDIGVLFHVSLPDLCSNLIAYICTGEIGRWGSTHLISGSIYNTVWSSIFYFISGLHLNRHIANQVVMVSSTATCCRVSYACMCMGECDVLLSSFMDCCSLVMAKWLLIVPWKEQEISTRGCERFYFYKNIAFVEGKFWLILCHSTCDRFKYQSAYMNADGCI